MGHSIHSPTRADNIKLYIIGTIAICFGFLSFIRTTLPELTLLYETRAWVETEAILVSFDVGVHHRKPNYGSQIRSPGMDRYYAKVKYKYTYGGRTYLGSRVTLETFQSGSTDSGEKLLGQLRRAYQTKTPIMVYVNPEQPYRSTITRTVKPFFFMLGLFMSIGLGGIGLQAILVAFERRRDIK